LAVLVAASLPYLGSLGYPLLYDDRTLLDNPWLRRARPTEIFARDFWHGTRHAGSDLYRPLTILTLWANLRLAPTRFGFRSANLLLHLAATAVVLVLLDRVARGLDRLPEADGRARSGSAAPFRSEAVWGAALFGVHPLASQAVLTAVGRAEILAALFGMLAFSAAMEAPGGGRRGAGAPFVSAAFFLAALCSKESAASWPAILLTWWLVGGRRAFRERRSASTLLSWAAAFGVFLAVRGAVVGWTLREPPWVDNPLAREPAATRIANAILLQGLYFAKMLLPARLTVEYGFAELPVRPLLPWALGGAAVLVCAWGAVLVLLARWSRPASFFWTFIPLSFAVTSNVFFPIGTIFAERLAYLPLVGGCGLVGIALARAARARRTRAAIGLAVLAAMGTRTAARAHDYRSLVAFDEATAAASPRSVKALANAGRTRLRTGRPREAAALLERAVSIWPDYPRALSLLADAYEELGRQDEAIRLRHRAERAARALGEREGLERAEPEAEP